MHTSTHSHMLITPLKTLLEHTQTPTLMETIRTILEHVLYVGITLPLIISLLATIITDTKQLRAWAKGQGGEGEEGPHLRNSIMKQKYTTAFIGITLSGELFTILQFQGTLIECARWRREHKEELEKLYGEIQSVTIKHKR